MIHDLILKVFFPYSKIVCSTSSAIYNNRQEQKNLIIFYFCTQETLQF